MQLEATGAQETESTSRQIGLVMSISTPACPQRGECNRFSAIGYSDS
ncbi:hypothetical protein WQQ_05570 [Hydrocarboniphaga effusa AP103]|uniref:Uncharacterized protein n=1 Tax=Hydrocarboniphaga effusa AP103 TaxID=1172194 RepID=I8T8X7_9GAMM|nr:hypothetical protein WQQ_05570 [Hydrocarboniphaga effusa AP103]